MTAKSDQQAADLALIEYAALRGIFDREGVDAFDSASTKLLTSTAAIISKVSGRQHLHDLIDVILEAQRRESMT